jgi:hypothetical protein
MTETKKKVLPGAFVLEIGIWNLDIVCNLEFGIWNLSLRIASFIPVNPKPSIVDRFHLFLLPLANLSRVTPHECRLSNRLTNPGIDTI